jgi:hypothetical protein
VTACSWVSAGSVSCQPHDLSLIKWHTAVALQGYKPASHTIIEAHPDVYAHMLAQGWDKKPGVRILFGRWQDVLHQLDTYDGIFFDT